MPNMKFKALVLIPSRMDSVRVSACVCAHICVCVGVCTVEIFGNHKTKLGEGEVAKRKVALGGSHGEASLFVSRLSHQVMCHFLLLSPDLGPSRVQGCTHTHSLVNRTG